MSENEKRLRSWIEGSQWGLSAATKASLLRDLDGALSAARDAALEEAEALAARIRDAGAAILRPGAPKDMRDILAGGTGALNAFIHEVRALRSQPAQSIPVAKVREVVLDVAAWAEEREQHYVRRGCIVEEVALRLGVPLDGEPEACVGCGRQGVDLCDSCEAEAKEVQDALARDAEPDLCGAYLCFEPNGHDGACSPTSPAAPESKRCPHDLDSPDVCAVCTNPDAAPEGERCEECGHARHPGMSCPAGDWRTS